MRRQRQQRYRIGLVVVFGLCLSTGLLNSASPKPASLPQWSVKTWGETQQWLKTQTTTLVVLDIWTTTCGTCREAYPELLALQKQFAGQPVTVVSLNCDYDGIKDKPPEFYRPQIEAFLKQHPGTLPQIQLATPFIDFLEEIDLSSTPAICLYDRGKLLVRFDNDNANTMQAEFTQQQIVQKIEAWLARPVQNATTSSPGSQP